MPPVAELPPDAPPDEPLLPPVLLAPVNFEAIYRQRLEQPQEGQQVGAPHEVPIQ